MKSLFFCLETFEGLPHQQLLAWSREVLPECWCKISFIFQSCRTISS